MAAKKPKRITAPKVDTGAGDLASALAGIQKAGNRKRGGPVKRHSNNPSRVPVKEALRVSRSKLPTQAQLEHDTASSTILAEGGRVEGMPLVPSVGDILGGRDTRSGSKFDEVLLGGGTQLAAGEEATGDVEYLSPPPTIHPGRPRALEASYNRETKVLRVVFRDGGTYAYYGVPTSVWRACKRNRSFGQTLDRLVINTYPFEKTAF